MDYQSSLINSELLTWQRVNEYFVSYDVLFMTLYK